MFGHAVYFPCPCCVLTPVVWQRHLNLLVVRRPNSKYRSHNMLCVLIFLYCRLSFHWPTFCFEFRWRKIILFTWFLSLGNPLLIAVLCIFQTPLARDCCTLLHLLYPFVFVFSPFTIVKGIYNTCHMIYKSK